MPPIRRYSRDDLLRIKHAAPTTPSRPVRRALWLNRLLRPPIKCTVGRGDQLFTKSASLSTTALDTPSSDNKLTAFDSIPVHVSNTRRPDRFCPKRRPPQSSALRPVSRARSPRHSLSSRPPRFISLGLLNIRSLHHKVDDVLEIQRDLGLDLMLLVETWHDADSACIGRLRQEGFTISDRPRPRLLPNSLSTNHGGVAAVSAPGLLHSKVNITTDPLTFESVCLRLSSHSSSFIILLIYRTGPLTAAFFDEFSDVLDSIATLSLCSSNRRR